MLRCRKAAAAAAAAAVDSQAVVAVVSQAVTVVDPQAVAAAQCQLQHREHLFPLTAEFTEQSGVTISHLLMPQLSSPKFMFAAHCCVL
jgi:hypothetical protein